MNRGGAVVATPGKTPLKDGGNPVDLGRATKSGRKVKRPAHFDDSPDAKKTTGSYLEEDSPKRKPIPEAVKKSARKTIFKSGEDSPKNNGQSDVEASKKSARKTLMKQDSREEEMEKAQKPTSRRTITPATSKEESPDSKPAKESARKAILKSVAKSSSLEHATPKKDKPKPESPKKSVKKVESVEEETPPAGPGISRTGRKIKVPAHLKEFEDVVVASPKKEAPEKPTSRKSLAPVVKKQEAAEEKVAPKTPGRGRSLAVARKAAESDPEETKEPTKTLRRGKSLAAYMDEGGDPLALPPSPEVVSSPKKTKQPVKSSAQVVAEPVKVVEASKTPKRGKSLAPSTATKSPVMEEKHPAKTSSQRAKSIGTPARMASPEKAPKTPKVSRLVEDSAEPVSRSGRKIKPKKYFGEFEEDQPEAIVAKVASPVKIVAKSSPVSKKMSPPKKVSPVKRHQLVDRADESPKKKPKLESKPTTEQAKKLVDASPKKKPKVEPKAVVEEVKKVDEPSPKRKPKLEPKPSAETKKIDEISPNTEERLITKRGVNDHHHPATTETPPKKESARKSSEKVASPVVKKEPVEEEKPKRGRKTLSATSDEAESEPEKPAESVQEKPKRGRKTLPAPSDDAADEEPPKAPKTPVARRMTTAATVVAAEDVGSSRSGRKIKPKKFFGEEEENVTAAKPKAATTASTNGSANGGGRGKRKTLSAELDKEDDEPKKAPAVDVKEPPKVEVEQCPSREEIMAVVGAVDPVEEMMEELHTGHTQEETKQDSGVHQLVPMEEDKQPELAAIGQTEESTGGDYDLQEELSTPEPAMEDVPMSTDDDVPVPEEEIQPVEPVVEEGQPEPDPADDKESTLPEAETVESALEENFQEASVPQTSPAPCPPTEEVQIDPAPLPEDPPVVKQPVPEDPPVIEPPASEDPPLEVTSTTEEPLLVGEPVPKELPMTSEPADVVQSMSDHDPEPQVETTAEDPKPSGDVPDKSITNEEPNKVQAEPVPVVDSNNQPAEISASSSFSEALIVEDDAAEQPTTAADDSKGQQYESVEFLELSSASTTGNEHPVDAEPTENAKDQEQQPQQQQQAAEEPLLKRVTTPELEDDIDNTEVPPMDDIDDEEEEELLEDVPEPTDESFLERDRDNESIIVIPDTPKPPPSEINVDIDVDDKVSTPQTSHAAVARVELPSSPVIMKDLVPSTPRTPESNAGTKTSTCSPDKPEDQEQANVPLDEVIEISDSPIAVLKSELTDCKPGSATSTPLGMGSKMSVKDRLIENSRKRSLSVDSEMVKKNVTFHSPANSTILVDTLDERLKKKNESATKPPQGHRKRSFSEHKDVRHASNDGPKPAKISKLPNFKNIHQQQFNRMESIEEFHNRKVQRAKEILAHSTVKSPAATALVRGDRPPLQKSSSLPPKSPHKFGNGTTSSSASKAGIARPSHMSAKPTDQHKPLTDAERQEKRQKQFQATFKSGGTGSDRDTPDGAHRVIEQSRHKQNQILKGVRTNKRFELLMKFRDAQE